MLNYILYKIKSDQHNFELPSKIRHKEMEKSPYRKVHHRQQYTLQSKLVTGDVLFSVEYSNPICSVNRVK